MSTRLANPVNSNSHVSKSSWQSAKDRFSKNLKELPGPTESKQKGFCCNRERKWSMERLVTRRLLSESRTIQKDTLREVELRELKKPKKYPHSWKRSRSEMVRDILRCLPEKITRISYGANLSWSSALKLLRFCENQDLVACENGIWYLTDRGQTYVSAYDVIEAMTGT